MDRLPPAYRDGFLRDLRAAQAAVRGGVVSDKRTAAEYANWRSFCADHGICHFFDNPEDPVVEILQVFGHRVKNGRYSKQSSVRADTVASAWRAIAQTHLLEGRRDPRKPLGMATRELDLRLARQLRHYSFLDPPSRREKAVPLGLVVAAAQGSQKTAKGRCLGDLIQLAIYFCLRSCEYSKTNSHKRTTQFRFRDIQFHDARGVIPFDAPAARIRRATAVTLYLDTQKNSVRGEAITMEASGIPFGCAVGAAAERFLHLRLHNADLDTPICTYFTSAQSEGASVTSSNVVATLRLWAAHIGFQRLGFHPMEIGSHSLRSGGAMTLHQAGMSDSTIKVIGRWKSDAFIIYLQGQVLSFTKGVATAMKEVMWFQSSARTLH